MSSRSCAIWVSAMARSVSTASSGNRGAWTTSWRSSSASLHRDVGTENVQPIPSSVTLVPMLPPSSSEALAISRASRRAVPFSEVRTMIVPTPAMASGSATAPPVA